MVLFTKCFCALALCLVLFSADAQLPPVKYQAHFTEHSFQRTLNIALPEGSIAVNAGVENGAAVYEIPLKLPPGIGGVKPEISLRYQSFNGNGLLGKGWSISGLSAISVVPPDDFADSVNVLNQHISQARFALNGEVLLELSSDYGAYSKSYGLPFDDFSVIESHGSAGLYPHVFTLTTKQGIVFKYGSRMQAQVRYQNEILQWNLSKIEYPDGRFIEFEYMYNSLYLSRIIYNESHFNRYEGVHVDFIYNQRADVHTEYIAGLPFEVDLLLTEILVRKDYQMVSAYQLKYAFENDESLLVEMEHRGKNNLRYNSTIFKYGHIAESTFSNEHKRTSESSLGQHSTIDSLSKHDVLKQLAAKANSIAYTIDLKVFEAVTDTIENDTTKNSHYKYDSTMYVLNIGSVSGHNFLTSVIDGNNVKTSWQYASTALERDTSNVNQSDSKSYFNELPQYLASAFWVTDAANNYLKYKQYEYSHAILHSAKGFLGFEAIQAFDGIKGVEVVSKSTFNAVARNLLPVSTQTYLVRHEGQRQLAHEVLFSTKVLPKGANRYNMLLQKKTIRNFLNHTYVTCEVLEYDDFGNALKTEQNVNGLERTVTRYKYKQFGTPVPASAVSKHISKIRKGQKPFDVHIEMQYFPEGANVGKLMMTEVFAALPKSVFTQYIYNQSSNVYMIEQVSFANQRPIRRNVQYVYDELGRYIETVNTNQGDTILMVQYDPATGNLLAYTDSSGLQATFEFNGIGSLQSARLNALKTDSDAEDYCKILRKIDAYINSPFTGAQVFDLQLPAAFEDLPYLKVLYDFHYIAPGENLAGIFKPVSPAALLLDLNFVAKENCRVAAIKTLNCPCNGFAHVNWQHSNVLQSVGREHVQFESGMPGTENLYKNGLKLVSFVAFSGDTSQIAIDASGKVVTVNTFDKTYQYEYFSHGGLKSISKNEQILLEASYNEFGSPVKLTDKSAGTVLYEFDGFGQMLNQVYLKHDNADMD